MPASRPPFALSKTRLSLVHLVVIALSVLLTIMAWQMSKRQIEQRVAQRFYIAAETTASLIKGRLARYEDALWAGVASQRSHGGAMTHENWVAFARELQLEKRYPGANGIGVIHALTAQTLPGYLARQRQNRPGFNVKPGHDFPFYLPITSIVPVVPNRQAVGLDVAHEQNRRTAALASRDSGQATITGPIVLVQDAQQTAGFLFYAPFYKPGPIETPQQRRDRFAGAVYAPIIVEKLMEGLMRHAPQQVTFQLRDGGTALFKGGAADQDEVDPDPMHSAQIPLNLYGRTWLLDVQSNLSFRAANTYAEPTYILVGGILVEVLIIALLLLLTRANKSAVRYANEVTAALRHKSEELGATVRALHLRNNELEQLSYVASHDLKTPIRGIGALVEMIEEDLDPYFKDPDANPEIRANLTLIQDRVVRMTELTNGILELSRVGSTAPQSAPVLLQDLVTALVSDFALQPDQISVGGDVQTICHDPLNLRRVLENLVSNAVKYQQSDQRLQIALSADLRGPLIEFRLRDNGIGIDRAYHAKIFEMFQTLHHDARADSTGIGLAIVKKAVARHGGRVAVDSEPGKGTEFFWTWPSAAKTTDAPSLEKAA